MLSPVSFRRFVIASLSLQLFSGLASAWQFAPNDCTAEQQKFLTDGFNNAFGLNTIADAALTNPSDGQAQVYTWLFGPEDAPTRQSVQATLNKVSAMNNPNLGRADFKVYCTTNRLKFTTYKGKPKTYDSELNENLQLTDKFDCTYNLAITYPPHAFGEPTRMQICPWFLQYAMKKNPAFQDGVQKTLWSKIMTGIVPIVKKTAFTDIDVLSLIDKVLLHEMTHVGSGATIDVGGPLKAYGWKNCRALSTARTNSATNTFGPDKNADSIALFASACHLILNGGTMNGDGTFTNGGNTKRWLDVSYPMLRARAYVEGY